jgi:hypothetical protein
MQKYCINCKHESRHECRHSASIFGIDVVTGEADYHMCRTMRHRGAKCGPDAKLFEPTWLHRILGM